MVSILRATVSPAHCRFQVHEYPYLRCNALLCKGSDTGCLLDTWFAGEKGTAPGAIELTGVDGAGQRKRRVNGTPVEPAGSVRRRSLFCIGGDPGDLAGLIKLAEDVDHIRIELRPPAAVHDFQDFGLFHPLAVSTVRSDGVIDIGNAQNPREQWNLLPLEMIRIAVAVVTFVCGRVRSVSRDARGPDCP